MITHLPHRSNLKFIIVAFLTKMISFYSLPLTSCWTTSLSSSYYLHRLNLHTRTSIVHNRNKIVTSTFSTNSKNHGNNKSTKKWRKPITILHSSTNNSYSNNKEEKEEEEEKEEVTIQFETCNDIKQISVQKGELLRTALMKRGISPHNGRSRLINCRGLGTCGTCAVEVTAMGDMDEGDDKNISYTNNNKNENLDIIQKHSHDGGDGGGGAIQPLERTMKENLRLNFPPHGSNDQSDKLRLACQIQIYDDVHVTKKNGFWGQSSIQDDVAEEYDAQLYFGDLEYILDDKSPS